MFGIGPMEIVVIMVVALLFVGPQRLPELAKQMGRFFVHAKRMTSDVRSTIDGYMKEAEAEIIAEERKKIKALIEAEIKDVDTIKESTKQAIEGEYVHPDHLDEHHHSKDEYFETAADDPAYQQDNKPNEDEVWSPHKGDVDSPPKG